MELQDKQIQFIYIFIYICICIYLLGEKGGGGGRERLNYVSRFSTIIPDIYRYGSEMPNSNRSFLFHSLPLSHEQKTVDKLEAGGGGGGVVQPVERVTFVQSVSRGLDPRSGRPLPSDWICVSIIIM